MVKHWVMVGDGGGAKVYETDALLEELQLVEDVTFSEDGVRHAGGNKEHLPGAGRDARRAEHDPHQVAEERFARSVAQSLNEADGKHRFERLIVVAPPRFLGEFRLALSSNTSKRVVASIHHDWTKLSRQDLSERLRKNMPEMAGMD